MALSMSRHSVANFTSEQLIEALEKTRGFILSAQKYLLKSYGIKASYHTIRTKIREWGFEDWIEELRKSLVEDCMSKAFHKAIQQGDNSCLFWVLEKYSHQIDFLKPKLEDTETESKKGWKILLSHVKGTTESDTEKKSD